MKARKQVLLVEDNADIRELLHLIITRAGHRVYAAATGGEALLELSRHSFNLIISDIGLPDIDGFTLLKLAAAQRPISCISMSAYLFETDTRAHSGCIRHFVKPFNPYDLLATIEAAEQPDNFYRSPFHIGLGYGNLHFQPQSHAGN
jgi:CheY-like chemotaxis protein